MIISEAGKEFIKRRESCVLEPHYDKLAGVWDIGYGHVFKEGEPRVPITQAEADALFDVDILYYVDQVEQAVVVPLNQWQTDALVSWTYNCGGGALRSSTMLTYINAEQHESACIQMLTWRKARRVPIEGLLLRRAHEVLIYMRGEYE